MKSENLCLNWARETLGQKGGDIKLNQFLLLTALPGNGMMPGNPHSCAFPTTQSRQSHPCITSHGLWVKGTWVSILAWTHTG